MCGSNQASCARFFNGNAEQLNRVPRKRYNRTRAKPRRANERKGLSNGSTKTTIRKRMSSHKGKGVGDSLAGDRDCSRRHEEGGAAVRNSGTDVAPRGGRHPRAEARGGGTQRADTVARDVPNVGERMASHGAADVQAINAEESSPHFGEAPGAAVRR